MGSWTAGARAPCRRGRAGPGCSVSVSTPPPCTASPLTRAAGPPSRPSQPLGRPPVQSPLRGCTDTLPQPVPSTGPPPPFCAIAIVPSGLTQSSSSTQQQREACGPHFSAHGSSLLQTLAAPTQCNPRARVSPAQSALDAPAALGSGQPGGAGRSGSPASCARAPAEGFSLPSRLRAGEPSPEAELWPGLPGTPCAPARCLAASTWATSGLSSGRPLVMGPGVGSSPAECKLFASRGLAALCLQGLAPRKRSVTLK